LFLGFLERQSLTRLQPYLSWSLDQKKKTIKIKTQEEELGERVFGIAFKRDEMAGGVVGYSEKEKTRSHLS